MTISVIIATFDRADLLAECLAYLARQPFAPGDEVIVVDNGSTDRTQAVLSAAAATMPVPLRCLIETTPGKSHALARALEMASGDVLAFTDDDVDVGDAWLRAIRRAMSDPSVALMGGPVVARWERQPPVWLRAAADGSGRLAAPIALLNYGQTVSELGERTVLGANMAVRRSAFTRVGGFATHLGKLRGTLLSGEDHDLCQRIQAAGLRAIYDPEGLVHHWVPASRMRISYYLSWFYWSGITHATLDGDATPARNPSRVPLYLIRRAAEASVRAAASAATGDVTNAVDRLTDIAFAAGYAKRRWRAETSQPVLHVSGDPL
jgi:GT2 family glycosyltransferase